MTQNMPGRLPGGGVDLSSLQQAAQQAPPARPGAGNGAAANGQGQVVDIPSVVFDITDQSFEQAAQLSAVVPVVIDLWADWCQPCKTLTPILERVTRAFEGRVVLGKIDVDANPGLAQAFQAQSIPTVVAIVGGRPVPLFQGAIPEDQVREYFSRLLELSVQQGVTGRVTAPDLDGADEASTPAEPEIPEAHRAAVEAAEAGDYARAEAEWDTVLSQAPADQTASAARVQIRLLRRLEGRTAEEIRSAAAEAPTDLQAQLAVADLDVSGGHVEDAFLRLLDLFAQADPEVERPSIQERLLELFEVVGISDPRVNAARGRLASLLY